MNVEHEVRHLILNFSLGAITSLAYTQVLGLPFNLSLTTDQCRGIAALGAAAGAIAPTQTLEAAKALPEVAWAVTKGICQAPVLQDPIWRANRDAQRFRDWRKRV